VRFLITRQYDLPMKAKDRANRIRTHRERKEIYIKSLEEEVLQLRNLDIIRVQEVKSLYSEIARLKGLLAHYTQLPIHDGPTTESIGGESPQRDIEHGTASIQNNSFNNDQIFLRQHDSNYEASNLNLHSGARGATGNSKNKKFGIFRKSGSTSPQTVSGMLR
jgi:hypothetical protein